MKKIDLRKDLKPLYSPGRKPVLVDVPELTFAMVDGHGDPNVAPEYVAAVESLFTYSYTLKFAIKASGGDDWRVMPLEGLWWSVDMDDFVRHQNGRVFVSATKPIGIGR